ncbi:uncharacterized protein LOC142829681 [Pelodiscus sinensis]|uniref:uncharacterized protein LOC142829681 n=1 Tax=Pelodiscus sinensis TaxID=13735 RepID=UPI003F6BD3FC
MEYILLVLYFSFFICLCALVCLYFSGCQEMTYKHEGKSYPLIADLFKLPCNLVLYDLAISPVLF